MLGLLRLGVASQAEAIISLRAFSAASNQLALIKELRERSGAPMTDVKAALQATDWDIGQLVINQAPHQPLPGNCRRSCMG
jgi:hypothetical protein